MPSKALLEEIWERNSRWLNHDYMTGTPLTLWMESAQDRRDLLTHIEAQEKLMEQQAKMLRDIDREARSMFYGFYYVVPTQLIERVRQWKEQADADAGGKKGGMV